MLDTWSIPAKTFFLGEYAALQRKSALLLTTFPCFELRRTSQPGLQGIHPQSPAGRWWSRCQVEGYGFTWYDPYQGLGGMGASSAQFIAVYQACAQLQGQPVVPEQMLVDYLQITATQTGRSPSGYDVLAQQYQGCVYINRETACLEQLAWPFRDVGFILVHTQHKLPTHEHLQSLVLTQVTEHLSTLVDQAKAAFLSRSASDLVKIVRAYHQVLCEQGWVAPHSLDRIERLYQDTQALAIKGCGAMGSDVLLMLLPQADMAQAITTLRANEWHILATQHALYQTQG